MGRWGIRVRGTLAAVRRWLADRPIAWMAVAGLVLLVMLGAVVALAMTAAHDVCDRHGDRRLHACAAPPGSG